MLFRSQLLGSPNYMPPEQADAKRGALGTQGDVYSLGAILYHLLTGRPPFQAGTLEDTLRQLLDTEPVAPCLLNASVPRDLETICLKCLEKEPKRRYGTALELAEDLGRWLRHEPIHARPSSSLDRLMKWTKRQPAIAALAASVLLLLVVVAAGSTFAALRLERARRQTLETLYQSYLTQARAQRLSGQPGRFFDAMQTITKAAAIRRSLELRNEAIACFAVEDLRLLPLGETNPPSSGEIIFDSALETFARMRADGDIVVRRVKDNQEVALIPSREAGVRGLRGFTDDGRFLAFYNAGAGLCVWNLSDRKMALQNLALPPGSGLVFLPPEDSFACANPDGSIAVYELNSPRVPRLSAKVSSGSVVMAFHPGSARLACFNAGTKAIEVVNLRKGKLSASITALDNCEAIVWSDDGKRLAAAGAKGRAYIWDAETGNLLQTCVGHDDLIMRLAFNHAGTLLATTSWDDTTRLWDPLSGAQVLRIAGSSYQLQFSADDQRLGYIVQGGQLGLLEVATHPEYRRLAPARENGRGGALAVSQDNRLVAGVVEGRVCLWDFTSGQQVGLMPGEGCASVFFDHDGEGLITCGIAGAAHWPLQRRTGTNAIQIGVRRALIPGDPSELLFGSMTADGNVIAAVQANAGEARVVQLTHPDQVLKLSGHPGMRHISISPDGNWIATGTWEGAGVKIWNGERGALATELPDQGGADVLFSPDDRWLVTGGVDYHLWRVGTWRLGPTILLPSKNYPRGVMAFSPDSQMLAISCGRTIVRLLEAKTARTLAEFEAPLLSQVLGITFSPDGGKLLASDGLGQIHVWDLRLIRQRLAAMQLDWDL